MVPTTVRLYRPTGPDKVAVVSAQEASGPAGGFLIRLARGTGPGPLQQGTAFGPYAESELAARFDDVLAALKSEGFRPTGVHDLLTALDSPEAAVRARAALGLGWRRAVEAVEPILAAFPKAIDEVCSYMDALGAIGDARAVPALREQAGRKLLSRRRSAVEALRQISDNVALAEARQRALERLPEALRQALATIEEGKATGDDVEKLAASALDLESQQRGLALDTLYELATPLAVAATRSALAQMTFDQANTWRYVKSIFKRAMLRHDYETFGFLSRAIEIQGRQSTGTLATVKSGYDGIARPVRIFAKKTQQFMRRLAWRYLRQLASHRPEKYPEAAAWALVAYAADDWEPPQGLYGQFSSCYVLHRILWGGSARFVMSERSLRFRFRSASDVTAPPTLREEAYAHLWDANPRPYLRVLSAGRLPEVQAFAVLAIEARHPRLLQEASHAEILAMLAAPYERTVALALAELERRFDPQAPDWTLLAQLLKDERPATRELGQRWLRLTAHLWIKDIEWIALWLAAPYSETRALAAELTTLGLRADATLRPALARHILELVKSDKLDPDASEGFVAVGRAVLLDEMNALLSTQEILDWIEKGPVATLGLAADLLARREDAARALGIERIAALAQHQISTIRACAHRLLAGAEATFRADPSILFTLVESEWQDTRAAAIALLRKTLDPAALGLDALMGLLDSNQVEAQDFGKEVARQRLGSLPADELAMRLVQHPHANMREFAMDLVEQHLPAGADPFRKAELFFRSILFDVWPRRDMKRRALDFLAKRGLVDEAQAAVAAGILGDVVRLEGRADFERALEALVRLKLAFPNLPVPITLHLEEVA